MAQATDRRPAPAEPTADQLRAAARNFFARSTVYGDDGQFQVTAWAPEAMAAARLLYDLAFAPTADELLAALDGSPAE